MKKKILKLTFFCLFMMCVFTVTSCNKNKDLVSSFPETVNNLKSYKLTGTLESNFPSGTKISNVTVYYKNPDLYRVELVLPNSLEKQVILKNNNGVYVLIPSINKNFKVSSKWPLTSSYPYLLQSLSKDIIADQDKKVEVKENQTEYILKAKLFDNAEETHQKIIFNNKTGYPEEIYIYKNDETMLSHFKVDTLEIDLELNEELFENNKTMETLKEIFPDEGIDFDRTLTYPTYCPQGLMLKEEVKTGSNDDRRIILTYGGTSFITILEEYITPYETLKTEYVDGDLYVLAGVVAVVGEDAIKFYEAGIEYTLASTNTEKTELVWIGDSLRMSDEK